MVSPGRRFLLIFLATVLAYCNAGYTMDSILCDDIEAICAHIDEPYEHENMTICGDKAVRFLNPEICNCGHRCISPLDEGDACSVSSTKLFPDDLCGLHLDCISEEVTGREAVCTLNTEKECIQKTIEYDAASEIGDLGPGQYRPNCKDDGTYAPKQCSQGSTCYCVDEQNRKLMGEAPATKWDEMDCACASYWQETEARGLDDGLRCLPNGNFDPLFCDGGSCYCYDFLTGEVDGPWPQSMITNIKCYDRQYHNENYTNICEMHREEWDRSEGNTTIIIDSPPPPPFIAPSVHKRPNCSRDGYYNPVQQIGSLVVCVDPYGERIENFTVPLHKKDEMDCSCPRRRYIMEENGLGASKPRCCMNGAYYPWQTRGLLAYCVDSFGNQVWDAVPITDVSSLKCYTNDPCPENNSAFLMNLHRSK